MHHVNGLTADLEFATTDNPGLDGEAATDAVVALVGEQLLEAFQIEMQPGWVLELDSSTEAKFSRHLVIGWALSGECTRRGRLGVEERECRAGGLKATLLEGGGRMHGWVCQGGRALRVLWGAGCLPAASWQEVEMQPQRAAASNPHSACSWQHCAERAVS